jgi:hypothetical protein
VIQIADHLKVPHDLGFTFSLQRLPDAAIEEVTHPGRGGLVGKIAGGINYSVETVCRHHASALANHQMQSDIELAMLAGDLNGLIHGLAGDHQAGATEDPVAMSA